MPTPPVPSGPGAGEGRAAAPAVAPSLPALAEALGLDARRLPTATPGAHATVDAARWQDLARAVAAAGGRLVAFWAAAADGAPDGGASAHAAYALGADLLWAELHAPTGAPDLSPVFPCAARMQRAAADLCGLRIAAARDPRPWLDHGLWGDGPPPLSRAAGPTATPPPADALPAPYPFVPVAGDGVHEIAVGPVHAGIIEPGHFRFSAVGEKVLRLEERLGYTHKGIERRFTEWPALDAPRLAGRVSGDTTVAYAWACSLALEAACQAEAPPRAAWLRALLLERERVANHLGDLGAIGNDAGLGIALAQFSLLREDWQRRSREVFGHRLLMDAVVAGGVAVTPTDAALDALRRDGDALAREVHALRALFDGHAGLQDRLMGTGRVPRDLALRLGLTGLAARASGIDGDLRRDLPWSPYDALGARGCVAATGDVAARVAVRFDEIDESLRLMDALCARLPHGAARTALPAGAPGARGVGRVEGWRGEVLVALVLDRNDPSRLSRCHCHDPSWQNWPVVEHAALGNIVPDFPLINKSFNLAYSGHDL